MKSWLFTVLPFFGLILWADGTTISTGDQAETVILQLGEPVGMIDLRDKTLLLYPQGEVTLRNGRVAEIDLMDETAFKADQARLEREREEWLKDEERRAELRLAKGEALRAERKQSGVFAALPAKDRVDFWRSFQIRYPEIDVSAEIAAALDSYQSEMAELRNQQRIAELEARVAEAEKEAAAARLETAELKEATEQKERQRNYGFRYYTDPVIRRDRHYYRPPTITIFTDGNGNRSIHQTDNYKRFKNGPLQNGPTGSWTIHSGN